MHLQLLALADDPRSEVARLDAIEPAPGRKGRTSVKRVLPAPPPEDPASIWGALRHWAANDPFCAYLFYTRWRWLARHDYQRFSAADHAAARLIASSAAGELDDVWRRKRDVTPEWLVQVDSKMDKREPLESTEENEKESSP